MKRASFILRSFGRFFMRATVSILAMDILYLYVIGSWQEPRTWILIIEIVGLSLLSIYGLVWAGLSLRRTNVLLSR